MDPNPCLCPACCAFVLWVFLRTLYPACARFVGLRFLCVVLLFVASRLLSSCFVLRFGCSHAWYPCALDCARVLYICISFGSHCLFGCCKLFLVMQRGLEQFTICFDPFPCLLRVYRGIMESDCKMKHGRCWLLLSSTIAYLLRIREPAVVAPFETAFRPPEVSAPTSLETACRRSK